MCIKINYVGTILCAFSPTNKTKCVSWVTLSNVWAPCGVPELAVLSLFAICLFTPQGISRDQVVLTVCQMGWKLNLTKEFFVRGFHYLNSSIRINTCFGNFSKIMTAPLRSIDHWSDFWFENSETWPIERNRLLLIEHWRSCLHLH